MSHPSESPDSVGWVPTYIHHAQRLAASAEPGWWDRLWPLVVTALLSLAVFWCVQFLAVPKVEARKRREDRWERDLLDLGQMLSFEVPAAWSRISAELFWETTVARDYDGDTRVAERLRERREAQWGALQDFRDLQARLGWLVDRVISIDRESQQLKMFRFKEIGMAIYGVDNLAVPFRQSDDSPPTEDEIRAADEAGRKALAELIDEVKVLAGNDPPRPASRPRKLVNRGRRSLKQVRERLTKRSR